MIMYGVFYHMLFVYFHANAGVYAGANADASSAAHGRGLGAMAANRSV